MSRISALSLVGFLAAAAPVAFAQSPSGTQHAILVAVHKYRVQDQWRTLPNTIEELDEFRQVLTKTGFDAENITFLHDKQTADKLQPTSTNILSKLKLILGNMKAGDTLVVALNGHGVQFAGDKTGYFAAVNADWKDKSTMVPLEGNEGIYGLLEKSKASRRLLIVNACRNDPARDASFAARRIQLADEKPGTPPEGIAAIFSCNPLQKSYESHPNLNRKRSIFFHYVIETWQGKYSPNGTVSLDHFFTEVTAKTRWEAKNWFDQPQEPLALRNYRGEWLLKNATDLVRPTTRSHAIKEAENSIKMKLVYVPPGTFQMGSVDPSDQCPQREVELTKGFYMGKHEVTQGEFQLIMKRNPSRGARDDDMPVDSATWKEAKEFCKILSTREGKTYRLPTEAEWEYACRAGTTTRFNTGDTIDNKQASLPIGERTIGPQLVGSFPPNAWGLCDMHGNVSELCEDRYSPDFWKDSPRQNPVNTKKGGIDRVVRGGAWSSRAVGSHFRQTVAEPDERQWAVGFRIVLEVND